MDIIAELFRFSIKDCIIIITSTILFLCIIEIRKLRKVIAQEVRSRLIPQLTMELLLDERSGQQGFFLRNESFFLAKDIRLQDVEMYLEDFGYKTAITLKFDGLDFLKPRDTAQLTFKVFDREHYLKEVTEKIIPHLLYASFKVKVLYANIENVNFQATFVKKNEKFYTQEIEPTQ